MRLLKYTFFGPQLIRLGLIWYLLNSSKAHTPRGLDKVFMNSSYCIGMMTRGGIYNEKLPEPEGNSEDSAYISPYIPTQVIKQTLETNNDSPSAALHGRLILQELILCTALAAAEMEKAYKIALIQL